MEMTAESVLELAALPDKVRREVPRVVNRLLGQTFLYQEDEESKDDYYLVHRHRGVLEAILGLAGFTLRHDDYHRIYQVVSDMSYCRKRYRLDETLMIVVLRKLYEDRGARLSLASDPVVTVGEVREEYRTITGKERDLGITQYEEILKQHSQAVDFCVLGEGERTMPELLTALSQGKSPAGVVGIAYREGDAVVRTAPRPLISSCSSRSNKRPLSSRRSP